MEKIFEGLNIEVVLFANFVISLFGFISLFKSKVIGKFKNLKNGFVFFWFFLSLYFILKLFVVLFHYKSSPRLARLLNLIRDPNITETKNVIGSAYSTINWNALVIVSDLAFLSLLLSFLIPFNKNRKKCLFVISIFFISWVISYLSNVNIISQFLVFFTCLFIAFKIRFEYIESSIIWILYGLLHFPFRLFSQIPLMFNNILFVILLTIKISLIVGMFKILNIKEAT